MRAACAALLLLAAPALAQQEAAAARRLVLDASRALQAGNAGLFLGSFDRRATADFERLSENVRLLVEAKDVASSVDVKVVATEGGVARLEVDWLLQLSPLGGLGGVEERRRSVRVDVRLEGKPKIVLLDPVDFFGVAMAPRPAPAP